MTAELMPRSKAEHEDRRSRGVSTLVVLACVAGAFLFYSTLLFGGSLHAFDWQSHHFNYFDWVRIALREFGTIPLFMSDAWVTKNFLANAESPSLGPLVWLLLWVPTDVYLKLLIVLFTAAGLGGMLALLKDVGVNDPLAAPVAIAFAFGGFFVSHLSVGHPWAMGGLLLPGLLCLYRRAALGSFGALWLAAAVNALTILGGQHQPFIWQNLVILLFALAWALRVRSLFPLTRWALVVACTAGIGAVKLLPMLVEFADYDPTARVQGLPLGLAFSTLVTRGQHPGFLADGVRFDHGSGWWEYAFYIGPVACLYLVAGIAAARRCTGLLCIGCFFWLLAVEWPASFSWLDIWPWFEGLPIWRTQRGPSRFMVLALFSFAVVAALGMQRLWDLWGERRPHWATPAVWVLALLVAGDLFVESLPWQRAALGAPLQSQDHRPKPTRLTGTHGAVAELTEFEPNRLVYRAIAPRESRVKFPFRLKEGSREWRVDGLPAVSDQGKLAVDLPAGDREVVMIYRPEYFEVGAGTSVATLVVLGIATAWRSRSRS
jgi:hypothetical protein